MLSRSLLDSKLSEDLLTRWDGSVDQGHQSNKCGMSVDIRDIKNHPKFIIKSERIPPYGVEPINGLETPFPGPECQDDPNPAPVSPDVVHGTDHDPIHLHCHIFIYRENSTPD